MARRVLLAAGMKLLVRSNVKAGTGAFNHSGKRLVVRSNVKAGGAGVDLNHNGKRLVVRSAVKAGAGYMNHNVKR